MQSTWALTALKDLEAISALWTGRKSAFLAVDFEWYERDASMVTELGYAGLASVEVDANGLWPPQPRRDYQCGHLVIDEYVDKPFTRNFHCPTYPWSYSFGSTRRIPASEMRDQLNGVIGELTRHSGQNLVILAHNGGSDLKRLQSLGVVPPPSTIFVDTCYLELDLFKAGLRSRPYSEPTSSIPTLPRLTNLLGTNSFEGMGTRLLETTLLAPRKRRKPTTQRLPLKKLLQSLEVPINESPWNRSRKDDDYVLHNAGNDAYLTMYAFQRLVDPTRVLSLAGVA